MPSWCTVSAVPSTPRLSEIARKKLAKIGLLHHASGHGSDINTYVVVVIFRVMVVFWLGVCSPRCSKHVHFVLVVKSSGVVNSVHCILCLLFLFLQHVHTLYIA